MPKDNDELSNYNTWIEKIVGNVPDPSPEQLSRFDHLRNGFVQAFQDAYKQEESLVDVVFSISGRILETAKDILIGFQNASGVEPAFVPAQVRSAAGPQQPPSRPDTNKIGQVKKKTSGQFLITATTYKELEFTRLEIDLITKDNGGPFRPFDVSVMDDKGQSLRDLIHVDQAHTKASFSGPAAGSYIFDVTWADGKDTISVQFK